MGRKKRPYYYKEITRKVPVVKGCVANNKLEVSPKNYKYIIKGVLQNKDGMVAPTVKLSIYEVLENDEVVRIHSQLIKNYGTKRNFERIVEGIFEYEFLEHITLKVGIALNTIIRDRKDYLDDMNKLHGDQREELEASLVKLERIVPVLALIIGVLIGIVLLFSFGLI